MDIKYKLDGEVLPMKSCPPFPLSYDGIIVVNNLEEDGTISLVFADYSYLEVSLSSDDFIDIMDIDLENISGNEIVEYFILTGILKFEI